MLATGVGIGQADIKGFFEPIDHNLLLRAIDKQVQEGWHRRYIKRWLEAPVQHPDGRLEQRTQGTPQGGVISPWLANLFLHYAFDQWVESHWKGIQFARYADDIICHCRTEQEAQALKAVLTERFTQCGLTLHPEKTKIVYCKSWKNKADCEQNSFDFLGFTFRPRLTQCRDGILLACFLPAISQKAAKRIRSEINAWPWLRWIQGEMKDIIAYSQSKLRGWMAYYGKYGRGKLNHVLFHFDKKLSRWAKRKYKKLKTTAQAIGRINAFKSRNPGVFAHW